MLRALQHGVMSALWIQALLVNTVLIALAQRTSVLTRSGWVHAAALGTILWGCLGWSGWLAVVAYCLLYTSPSPRDGLLSRMPSSA